MYIERHCLPGYRYTSKLVGGPEELRDMLMVIQDQELPLNSQLEIMHRLPD